jgi:hypothetical protein
MPLDTVQSTANAYTTGGRDGACHRAAGRLAVTLASPGTPGTGTNPAMPQALTATRVCFHCNRYHRLIDSLSGLWFTPVIRRISYVVSN